MAERRDFEQLDLAIRRLLAGDDAAQAGDLLGVAQRLRLAPAEAFRRRLGKELSKKRMAKMQTATVNYISEGMHSLNPYLTVEGANELLEFVKRVFDGEERLRVPRPDGKVMHAEIRIGDMTLEVADGPSSPVALHAYVPDMDTVYARAIEAGGVSVYAPVDQHYGDREACVRNASGVTWYIATHQGAAYKPEGFWDITGFLHPKGSSALVDFMERAFAAEPVALHRAPDGAIVHGTVRFGDTVLELGEAHGDFGPTRGSFHLYVPDVDAAYERALGAGATPDREPADQPYGERMAGVVDAWGNRWWLATHTASGRS